MFSFNDFFNILSTGIGYLFSCILYVIGSTVLCVAAIMYFYTQFLMKDKNINYFYFYFINDNKNKNNILEDMPMRNIDYINKNDDNNRVNILENKVKRNIEARNIEASASYVKKFMSSGMFIKS